MTDQTYFILFAFNIPIRGLKKSVIYNLQKSRLIFVPNVMIDFISSLKLNPISVVKQNLTLESIPLFDDYMDFLKVYELGFFTENKDEFPELKLDWKTPNEIISSIIEYDCLTSEYRMDSVLNQIEDLNCFHVEFFIKNTTLEFLNILSEIVLYKSFKSINFYVEYSLDILDYISNFYKENKKIEYIVVFNSLHGSQYENSNRIVFIEKNIDNEQFHFQKDQYILNIKYFTEALYYHPFFNRKICIDHNGDVKNDLSFVTSFGNVKSDSLIQILELTNIKEIWYACPDKVLEYKDDILRYCKVYTDELIKIENGYYKIKEV